MGVKESKYNETQEVPKKSGDIKMIEEVDIPDHPLHKVDLSIAKSQKSVCKIEILESTFSVSSGFLIQLFKERDKKFYCLMTNAHVIKKEMIEKNQAINVYYNFLTEVREIRLNPMERLIKDFKYITIDAIVIEIISKDNIPNEFFLLPLIDYRDKYNEFIDKEIAIIHYPKGELNYSYGKINRLTNNPIYEFSHNAGTDKGSSGSPIFLEGSSKVIGIHKGGLETELKRENFGDFIWPIFNYFKNFYVNNHDLNNIEKNNIFEKKPKKEIKVINNDININNPAIISKNFVINNLNEKVRKNVVIPTISLNELDSSGLLKNYGGLSRQGMGSIEKKYNQDTLVSLININGVKDFNIFGVLDGYGPEGHFLSRFASEFIPSQIINNPEIKKLTDPELIYQKLKENNCKIITESFISCDEQLEFAEFDAYKSGSTCILIIHINNHILCANVGDSRALVAYDDYDNDPELLYLEQAQLSIEYRPEIEEEKNRIISYGGIVEKAKNEFGEEIGRHRIWLKGQNYPGLAISRSIGDLKGKTIGIISEPGILEYDVNETTKYIVIASDGVWECLENEEVAEIGKSFYLENNPSALCQKIIDISTNSWKVNYSSIDDISIVTMFF